MKILLIHNKIPYPLNAAINKGITNYINVLKDSNSIDFLCPVYLNDELKDIEKFESDIIKVVKVPVNINYSEINDKLINKIKYYYKTYIKRIPSLVTSNYFKELEIKINEMAEMNDYDIIQFYSVYMSCYIRSINNSNYIVLGPIDDEVEASRLFKEKMRGKKKLSSTLNYYNSINYYRNIYKKCKTILFFSLKDLETTDILFLTKHKSKICLIPHEIEENQNLPKDNPYPKGFKILLFVGTMGAFFNQDAVFYFVNNIFPLVKKECNDVLFYVVGQNPPKEIQDLMKDENIKITGEVTAVELNNYLANADVYVSPLRLGTGIKSKIIEALKYGKAIVTTNHSLNALWGFNEFNIKVANDCESFAREIINILKDNLLKGILEKNARKLFDEEYSYKSLKPKLIELIKNIKSG